MKNPKAVIIGVVTVPYVGRYGVNAAYFGFKALVFYIMVPASVGDNIYFVKTMLVHPYGELHFFIVIVARYISKLLLADKHIGMQEFGDYMAV